MKRGGNQAARGSYALILRLRDPRPIQVGKLGTFPFPAGFYAYVGSALGPGGLAARLRHHIASTARPRWHVDYLTQMAEPEEVWLVEEEVRHEHDWAQVLGRLPGASVPAPGFGASDCRCATHLFHFPSRPALKAFLRGLGHPAGGAPSSPVRALAIRSEEG